MALVVVIVQIMILLNKAREGSSEASAINPNLKNSAQIVDREQIQKALGNTNKGKNLLFSLNIVAQEIFSLLPNAKVSKGKEVMSISGSLRQNKEIKFVESSVNNKQKHEEEDDDEDDGIITINKSQLVNREDYEREKLKQHSRADMIREQNERLARMMPNKNDRSKNNIRALAYDISGTIEQERATSQKTFKNSRRKYGW